MNLLERVLTLLRANLDMMAEKAEEPEKVLRQLQLDMRNQLVQVKTQVATAIAEEMKLQKRSKEKQGEANVWLIAGGKDKGLEYHDAGPLLSKRVKHAFLIGEAREKIHSAWGLFTSCTILNSLIEAVSEAASRAASGDVVLISPACSSFDQFRNYQERGESFCRIVKSISRGADDGNPNMADKT